MWTRIVVLLNIALIPAGAFVTPSSGLDTLRPQTILDAQKQPHQNIVASAILATAVTVAASNPVPAQAYVPSDYASETVQEAVQSLKNAAGNVEETFKAYENIAGIITEGKGVGGMVNYSEYSFQSVFICYC